MQDLQDQLGYTETQAYNAVYSGGLSIYSTQNVEMQKICDEEMNDDSNYPGLKEYGLDYALTVTRCDGSVENYGSGHVKKYAKEKHFRAVSYWGICMARKCFFHDRAKRRLPTKAASRYGSFDSKPISC